MEYTTLSKSLDLVHKYVWLFRFKDNNIIDKDVYHYNKTLEISNVNGLIYGRISM